MKNAKMPAVQVDWNLRNPENVRILVERQLSLSSEDIVGLRARVAQEIEKAKNVKGLKPSAVREDLGKVEAFSFLAREIFKHYKNAFRSVLASGKLGRLQRRLRGKSEPQASSQDYWPVGPNLLWDWHEKTHPMVVAYDNVKKSFVRQDFTDYQKSITELIVKFIEETSPETVLELGCGYGRNGIALHNRGQSFKTFYGLDFSPVAVLASIQNLQAERVADAKSRNVKYNFIIGDFKNTGLAPKSVDSTYCVWSLPYGCSDSNDMELIADEIVRITKNRALFVEPDLSRSRFGIRSQHGGFWNVDKFRSILESKKCRVARKILPTQFNWLIPIHLLDVEIPYEKNIITGGSKSA
jgi:SAM-dependent methyltransferase